MSSFGHFDFQASGHPGRGEQDMSRIHAALALYVEHSVGQQIDNKYLRE